MSLLQEAILERLWSRYESRFGAPPPISNADFDEAIALIREKLAEVPAGVAQRFVPTLDDGDVETEVYAPNFMHGRAYRPEPGPSLNA